jgi:hypothetical protein
VKPNLSRIVVHSSDGYVCIISPRSGEKLVTGYPIQGGEIINDVLYDPIHSNSWINTDTLYLLGETGRYFIFSCESTPCNLLLEWPLFSKAFLIQYMTKKQNAWLE